MSFRWMEFRTSLKKKYENSEAYKKREEWNEKYARPKLKEMFDKNKK